MWSVDRIWIEKESGDGARPTAILHTRSGVLMVNNSPLPLAPLVPSVVAVNSADGRFLYQKGWLGLSSNLFSGQYSIRSNLVVRTVIRRFGAATPAGQQTTASGFGIGSKVGFK